MGDIMVKEIYKHLSPRVTRHKRVKRQLCFRNNCIFPFPYFIVLRTVGLQLKNTIRIQINRTNTL